MTRQLEGMFSPKSIAVVGASESPLKVGAIVLKNIILSGYKGTIYPVNPNISEFGGLKFYKSIQVLPTTPELVVIAIPAKNVSEVLRNCGEKGVKNVVIFSSGYKEVGEEGAKLETELEDIAAKYNLNILGPNCLGFANTNPKLNVTFGQGGIDQGSMKLISQSGSLAASLFDWCATTKLGFDSFVTIGNKTVINENEILEYWLPELTKANNQKVVPVGMYLESISRGVDLVNVISKITPCNPVFILKPGRSENAAKAMQSHTGAIAGEDKVFDSAMIQAGAIRCTELGDFFDMAQALTWSQIPKGPRVAVVTNAGGPAVVVSDSINQFGLELARLSENTKKNLLKLLPKMASVQNPIDVLGDALSDRFSQVASGLIIDEDVDAILVVLTPQLMTEVEKTAKVLGEISKDSSKPVYCSFVGGEKVSEGRKILNEYKVANFEFPERAVKTLASIWKWENWRQNTLGQETTPVVANKIDVDDIQKAIDEHDKEKIMATLNITTPAVALIKTKEEAVNFATLNSWPVILKIWSPEILHKSDVGGVKADIRNEAELVKSFEELTKVIHDLQVKYQSPIKIEIQNQIKGGVEVILGIKRDPIFGLTILFGAGGKYAEILDDPNLISWPTTIENIKQIVQKSKVHKLLAGYRDDRAYDLTNLYEAIVRLGQFMQVFEEIKEMEINPMIITHDKTWAVDVKIVI